jgi:hypothetical protein
MIGFLKGAQKPPSTREIAEGMLRTQGIDKPTMAQIRSLVGAVHSSLRNHEGKSLEATGDDRPVRWRLIA